MVFEMSGQTLITIGVISIAIMFVCHGIADIILAIKKKDNDE